MTYTYSFTVGSASDTGVEEESDLLESLDFPLQFKSNGDLTLTSNDRAIQHDLQHAVMILSGGVPLAGHIGSKVPVMPFDPNDDVNSDIIIEEIARSCRLNVPKALVDRDIFIIEDDHSVRAVVPYVSPGRMNLSLLNLAIPVQDID